MPLLPILCTVALTAIAFTDGRSGLAGVAWRGSNGLIDKALLEMHRQAPKDGLEPVRVQPFKIKVKSTAITNRNVIADFDSGVIVGLSKIARQGNCSDDVVKGDRQLVCNLDFASVKINMTNVKVKGDYITGKKHTISTLTTVVEPRTAVIVEIEIPLRRTSIVKRLMIKSLDFKTFVADNKLKLNASRLKDFKEQVNAELVKQLNSTLTGNYTKSLQSVLTGLH